jgi:hypothetical protein
LRVTLNSNPSAGSGPGVEGGEGEGEGDGDGGASIQCMWLQARLLSPCRPRLGGGDELWAPPPRLPPQLPRRLPPQPRPDGRASCPPHDPIPLTMVPVLVWRRTVGKNAASVCEELAGRSLFKKPSRHWLLARRPKHRH